MQRDPIRPSQVVLRFVTLAITIVVGFQVGPRLSLGSMSVAVVGGDDQKVSQDAFKAGERREPRVFAVQLLDRLPPARPSDHTGAVPRADEVFALGTLDADGRSDVERPPTVKHVPRMERGDPPRI